ncbi:nuclear transport factor 2 family protein [Altererythrobacter salegens]|uniref:Nuclear transport factor 2 family protein n=1 Tax=Croceibacterium salegens TaxID=1737568 RepID=A0A6I4SXE2_9SPHN|nr:nuclear transport factor 2 family protein [Croceibacterium salegens]MXO59800.1 nuclear transport factor 2 family protein [Croceibacterium salegens]
MRSLAVLAALALMLPAPALADAKTDAEIAALTLRVEKLEGHRAVKKLQRAFGYYVDRGLWKEASDLFTDDGSVEIGIDGVYVGKDRIEEYLRRLHGGQEGLIYGQLNEWVTLQPAIVVADDGRSAVARWRDLGMLGQYKEHAEWRDGIYENVYEKGTDGIWRIKALHLYVNFVAPVEKGWARLKPGEGLVRSQASIDYPPDRGSTSTYQPFPAVQVPPFQAPNPVTGKRVEASR